MSESKHKHARRRAEPDPERARRWRTRIAAGLVVVGVVVAFRLLTGGTDEPAEAIDDPGATPGAAAGAAAGDGTAWITPDGSAYRMTVRPETEFLSVTSPSGCIQAAAAGTTNLRFTVLIENRTPTAAPVPEVEFAANLTKSGSVEPSLRTFAKASRRIEVVPLATARTCDEAARLGPTGRDPIPPGASVMFTGTLAGVATPVGDGLALLVRYVEADAEAEKGSSTTLVRVPFPEFPGD